MSKPVGVAWAETADELERRYRAERDVERRKRLGALWRVRGGDRLTAEQRAARLEQCAVGAFPTYEEARAWVATEDGVSYRPGGLSTALRRPGVRPRVPRPVAEKADPAQQEAWRSGG